MVEDKIAIATQNIHKAVSGLTVLEAVALLEIASAQYKSHVTSAMAKARETTYVPIHDDLVDVI